VQEGQAESDEADDHGSNNSYEGPPKEMVRAFLAKPPHLGLVAQPTKCWPPVSFAAQTAAVFTDPLKFGTPCSFHLWLGHRAGLYET
jgi:hypothetical protein